MEVNNLQYIQPKKYYSIYFKIPGSIQQLPFFCEIYFCINNVSSVYLFQSDEEEFTALFYKRRTDVK